jgi:hypothetical protein
MSLDLAAGLHENLGAVLAHQQRPPVRPGKKSGGDFEPDTTRDPRS